MVKASDFLVALDDGHGPHTAGKRTPFIASIGRQIRENEFNKAVVELLEVELKRCGFRTLQLAPTDLDTHLTTRTNTANRAKANLLVSVHFNAMGNTFEYSSAKGFSVHIQEGSTDNSQSFKAAKLMIEELAKGTAQTNRDLVRQNLAITRQSTMPAVLVECGFMDDPYEAMLMINKAFQQEVARELATAICRYFGVPYIEGNKVSEVSNAVRGYFMIGDRLPGVGIIQSKLNRVGYKLTVDDIFGSGTESAVKAFQRASGLVVDGIAGKATMSKLDTIIANLEKPAAPKPIEKEDDTMEATAVVVNQAADIGTAALLAQQLGCGVFFRRDAEERQVAKTIYIAGGGKGKIKADKFIDLSGKTRQDTAKKVTAQFK